MKHPPDPSPGRPVLGRASAWAPGTCGELAQGMLNSAVVMVTCPIDRFAKATVDISPGEGLVHGPSDCPKSIRAVELALEHLGRTDVNAVLSVESPIPRAKGMASSTADVLAAMTATAAALKAHLSVRTQAELAVAVEPSDGTMFPGVALFDHRQGRVSRSLGDPPPMRVLVLEFAEKVDTRAFNSVDRQAAWEVHSQPFAEAIEMIALGLKGGDARLVGQGATVNAIAYQQVFPNQYLDAVLSLSRATGAVGVNVAHSGSAMGLLFPKDEPKLAQAAGQARTRLPGLTAVHAHRLIGGGVRLSLPSRRDLP